MQKQTFPNRGIRLALLSETWQSSLFASPIFHSIICQPGVIHPPPRGTSYLISIEYMCRRLLTRVDQNIGLEAFPSRAFFHAPTASLILGNRAPTTASLSSPAGAAATARPAAPAALARRRSHKGKVHRDGLVQQLGLVGAVNRGPRLLQRGVLDQCVALRRCFSNVLSSARVVGGHVTLT